MKKTEMLRGLYEDLTDEEIEKAVEQVNYVLYDSATGEIIQTGNMDRLAYERFEPYREGMEKAIVPPGEEWMLRGEFIDHENTQKPMFKIEQGELVAKERHTDKINEMRRPKDGMKGGRQEPVRIEKKKKQEV